MFFFFFSSRRRHTRYWRDWSSDVCSSDLTQHFVFAPHVNEHAVIRRVINNWRSMNMMSADRFPVGGHFGTAASASGRKEGLHKRSRGAGVGHLRGIKETKVAVFAPTHQESVRKNGR